MDYKTFREQQYELEFLSDLYVELRGAKGVEKVAAFFDVYEASDLESFYEANQLEVDLRTLRINQISQDSLKFRLFCDWGEKQFLISAVSDSEDEQDEELISESELKELINSLPQTSLSGKSPRPPRYPDRMSQYSVWHYTLDWSCKCRDIDYVEVRDGKASAILEVTGNLNNAGHLENSISMIKSRLDLQTRMMGIVGKHVSIPYFIVIHTNALDHFVVFDDAWSRVYQGDDLGYLNWLATL